MNQIEAQRLAAAVNQLALPGEEWRPIPGYERTYLISSLGRVYSIARPRTPGGIRRQNHDRHGYPMVTLVQDGVQTKRRVHLWVMLAFNGPTPSGQEIRHIDGDPGNAARANLEFGSHLQNMQDMVRHRTARPFCKRGHARVEENLGKPNLRGGGRACLQCRRERNGGGHALAN